MNVFNDNIFSYIGKNISRYDDEYLDDLLEFEDEIKNQDKFNRSILNIETNKQDLIGDDNGDVANTNLS